MKTRCNGACCVLAPTAKDAEVTRSLLCKTGLECLVCVDLICLSREVEAGAGALLLTEEVITDERIGELLDVLHRQPAWSELPIVVLMRGAAQSPAAAEVSAPLGNVTLLERPAPMRSVLSAVDAAVRGRRRQYQIRDQIDEIRRAEAALGTANRASASWLAASRRRGARRSGPAA